MKTVVKSEPRILLKYKQTRENGHRTKYDIWTEILESCLETGRTKFWLISRLNLSSVALDKCLKFLEAAKLIEAESFGKKTKYRTNLKGKEAVDAYHLLVKNYYSL